MADLPKLRAVVFQDGDWWVVQFLEYDFVTMAKSLENLPQEVERILTLQVQASLENGIEPFETYKPAPLRFWRMYQRATPRVSPYSTELRIFEGVHTKEALAETFPPAALGPFRRQDHALLPEEPRCELLYGRLYRAPSSTPLHQLAVGLLSRRLEEMTDRIGGLVFHAPLDVTLADHTVVQPDVLYVTRDRMGIVQERIEAAPDLVVEVLAPDTVRCDRGEKLRVYAEFGVREYWLVDPIVGWIDFLVNRDGRFEVVLAREGTYRSAVLPGVDLDLVKLLDEIARRSPAS
jgi:Uma2 family endonuclease